MLNKKEVKAKELKPDQTIRFEFGVSDNWVTLHIERICGACEEKMTEHVKQEPTKMIYRPSKREVCHAG